MSNAMQIKQDFGRKELKVSGNCNDCDYDYKYNFDIQIRDDQEEKDIFISTHDINDLKRFRSQLDSLIRFFEEDISFND